MGLINAISDLFRGKKLKQLEDEIAEFHALQLEIDKARCVVEYNTSGSILKVNKNWLDALGYQSADMVGHTHIEFISPDERDTPEVISLWSKLSSGENDTGRYRFVAKDGSVRWFQGYFSPIPDAKGRIVKVVSYMTDITAERMHSINSELEAVRIRSAMDASSAAVMAIDRDFIVTYFNDATTMLFKANLEIFRQALPDFNPDQILGTSVDVFHKNPAHQRKLLSDPSRLPYTTQIKLGPLNMWLYVTAIYDHEKNYVGNVLEWRDITKDLDNKGQVEALNKTQGVVELDLDGTILRANDIYLDMLGYKATELTGKHVSIVLDPVYAKSDAYSTLWSKLQQGNSDAGQYKRIAKDGREVWIQASYNPVNDFNGKPFKIVNYTIDITELKEKEADNQGQIESINRSLGVIEFSLDGKIRKVNHIFAGLTGYSEGEILGHHHSMFVDAEYRNGPEYKQLWDHLRSGKFESGIFKRFGKGGKEIYLQASYNPVLDANGKPFKVVKFAIDITEQHNASASLAQAVSETQIIIEAAKAGNLSSRVSLAGKTGAIASLCDGVNALMDKLTEV
ncbi:MAG: PAS domain S-box protein, partial [Methylotenera sp.]|nr:PAS domain S-box protein [Methylotenera sp.]